MSRAALLLALLFAGCSASEEDPFGDRTLTVYTFETDDGRGTATSAGRIGLRPGGDETIDGRWEIQSLGEAALAGEGTLSGRTDAAGFVTLVLRSPDAPDRIVELTPREDALRPMAGLDPDRVGAWRVVLGGDVLAGGAFRLSLVQTGIPGLFASRP